MTLPGVIQLLPEYRDYVWGGNRLRSAEVPTAEAWLIWENNRVNAGPLAGVTLAELFARYGIELVGHLGAAQERGRFPLLIKLLDCAQWLSLQVHPNDAQALALEGPGQMGKTEAWHILDAAPGAKLIAGLQPGTQAETLEAAIRSGGLVELVRYHEVHSGDTVYMPAGLIHSLGPGLLAYEVQQTSDLTYRIYDWGRPLTKGRMLHIDKSVAVANPAAQPQIVPAPQPGDGQAAVLSQSPYFRLERLTAQTCPITLAPAGETFHALTVIEGNARLRSGQQEVNLEQYQTALVPACVPHYTIEPLGGYRMLKASLEGIEPAGA
jgi:mannose-6-phosphate isomerase